MPPCAIRDIIAAVAVGAVVIAGDKEDLARTAMLNEGHAVDVAELGADEETGADVLYELKSSASRRSARSTALARARRRSAASPSPRATRSGLATPRGGRARAHPRL